MSTPANVLEFYAQSNWGNTYHIPGPYYSGEGHHGFDLKTGGQAKAVPALRAGTVRHIESYGSVGTSIAIETAPGDFSGYSHLYGVRVAEGQWVEQGEILANVALANQNPGKAWTGPHLHLTRGVNIYCSVGLSVSDPEPLVRDVIGGGTGGGVPGGGGGTGGISVSVEQGKILQQVAVRGGYQGVQDGIPGVNTWKGVQAVITEKGFYAGPVDGIPGTNTWKGVQHLAQLGGYGGPVDGFPGDQTYLGLQSWLSEPVTPTVPAGPTGVYGVDVGPSQSNIDFGLLRDAGYQFSIIKAGGTNLPIYVSTYYQAQVGRARAAGMLVGHYWVVGSNDPAGDASFFLNNLYDFRTGDILALDNEALNLGRAWTDDECATFTQIVKNEIGYAPFIYMNGSRLSSSSWTKTRAVGCKLWFSNPNGEPGNITISAFSDWAIHQYSWTGQQGTMKIDLDMAPLSAFAGLTQPPLGETVPPINAFPTGNGGDGASAISVTVEQGKILQRLAQRGGYEGPVDGIPGGNTWKGVQQVLSDLHLYSGPVDGLPGGNTYRALQTLAREGDYEGPIDGVPGEMTFAALDRYLNGTTGGAPSMANGMILQRIAKAGGYTGAVDGVPGANTWRGLQQVLSGYSYRGPVDGVMGTNSWAALQRFAAKGGYAGVIDGVMGTNSWKGVQTVLAGFGYTGPVDGAPGKNSYIALQHIARLGGYAGPADGVMGTNSWQGLQTFLYGAGYTGPIDGVPGLNTYKTLQTMAARGGYNGPVDGLPGDNTYRALGDLLA